MQHYTEYQYLVVPTEDVKIYGFIRSTGVQYYTSNTASRFYVTVVVGRENEANMPYTYKYKIYNII
jgi:hypothetical protein